MWRALFFATLLWAGFAAGATGPVTVLQMEGAIGPATADYISRGIGRASQDGAQLVVLRTDTPGGLDTSMRQIVKAILASPVPVAVYVGPSGARAASAGTFILYASHVAAMAPGTNLGAATPVAIGGAPDFGGAKSPARKDAKGEGDEGEKGEKGAPQNAMGRKQVSDAAAFIRGLANLRGRNAEWAEKAVREAASLSADEALREKVIEYIAADVPELMKQLDGKAVKVGAGERTLSTAGAVLLTPQPDWRTRVLGVIADPSIALILMMLGIYGLFFEFMSPGFGVAGVIGAICLLLAMYSLHLMPLNYAGLALVILGIVLMISEAFMPGFGVLGGGGAIAFVIGAIFLFDTDMPEFAVPMALIVGIAATSALLMGLVGGIAWRQRKRLAVSGSEQMIGAPGEMLEDADAGATAWARVHGETWRVMPDVALRRGDRVRVASREGLLLRVHRQEGPSQGG